MATTEIEVPAFENNRTIDEERVHRKERLAASFRLFGKFGFAPDRGSEANPAVSPAVAARVARLSSR